MLKPCVVGAGIRGTAPNVTSPLIDFERFCAPFAQAERRICKNAVKLLDCAVVNELWIAQRIALHDLKLPRTVKEEVHSGDGGGRKILLLTINFSVGRLLVIHVSDGFNEHTTGATGRIIDRVARFRLKHTHHELDYRTRRVKLTRIFLAHVSEFFN